MVAGQGLALYQDPEEVGRLTNIAPDKGFHGYRIREKRIIDSMEHVGQRKPENERQGGDIIADALHWDEGGEEDGANEGNRDQHSSHGE